MKFINNSIIPAAWMLVSMMISVLPVGAQSVSNKVTTQVHLWFLFLDESEGAFYLKANDGFELLSGAPYSIVEPKSFTPGERIEIFKEQPRAEITPDAEANIPNRRRIKVAEVMVPQNIESALVVLAPAAPSGGNERSFQARIYAESPEETSEGAIKLINLGRSRAAVALGTERVVIEPGETKMLEAVTDSRNRLKVQVADNLNGEWNIIERRVIFMRPGERMTGVFVYSPSGMKHAYSRAELLSMGGDPPPGHAWLQFKH